jgi:hypothetical protein
MLDSNFIGKRFNRLLVIDFYKGKYQTELLCKCDCGNIRHFTPHQLNNTVKSCGCYIKEKTTKRNLIHGQNKRGQMSKEYKAWSQMKDRCYNDKYYLYHRYGGRGIKVCDRWLNSFENFFEDMGKSPSQKHSLDRFPNNDGDYKKDNCRWASSKEQGRNQCTNFLIEIDGVKKCVSEWAEIYNINAKTIFNRIYKGWDKIDSVIIPIRKFNKKNA